MQKQIKPQDKKSWAKLIILYIFKTLEQTYGRDQWGMDCIPNLVQKFLVTFRLETQKKVGGWSWDGSKEVRLWGWQASELAERLVQWRAIIIVVLNTSVLLVLRFVKILILPWTLEGKITLLMFRAYTVPFPRSCL